MLKLSRIVRGMKFTSVRTHHETIPLQQHMLSTHRRMSVVERTKYVGTRSGTRTFAKSAWVWV